jgi:nucleoside-diphosphate-sugar epimerase
MKRQALVTGGAGFIGSNLVERLIGEGWKVRVIDDLRLGSALNLNSAADFTELDIRKIDSNTKIFRDVDTVFHLAAESRNLPSMTGEATAIFNVEVNVIGTITVLEAAVNSNVRNFVYSASSTVYGNHPQPQVETMLPDCITPYGASKFAGEMFVRDTSNRTALSSHCLRYFQVFGPRQPESGPYALVTGIFDRQRREGVALTIEGDGSQTRDFVHVDDVVEANLRASMLLGKGAPINIGTGVATSIKRIADEISSNQIHLPPRKFDLPGTRAELTKCIDVFDWHPKKSIINYLRKIDD